ncbi:CoA transferase [Undibacterium sp. Ren11W]|uniref:CoA transferase n=1 Tax=Undibacterium sp. Ren11W TaxID=3413045 RepID=UPI003BF2B129
MSATSTLQSLWKFAGADPDFLQYLQFTGDSAQLPSVFQVGDLASASIAAQALMAAQIWHSRSGALQQVCIDQRHALAMFRSERYLRIDGQAPTDLWSPIAGYYQCGDGRWIQLHTNFPQHRDGVLKLLQCADQRDAVAQAIAGWQAAELEAQLASAGMCAAMIRTPQEWQAHAQTRAIAALPLFEIERIGDAAPRPFSDISALHNARPLSGLKALDLSRVIAAPVAARSLAQHGADVLAISAAHLPNITPLVIDTGRGKRSAQLDLRENNGRAQLHHLLRDADVFLQAYRPGALAEYGYSAQEMAQQYPGIIHVSLSAYGHVGPWAERRGFDSLVQSASGIAFEEGQAAGLAGPGKLPCQALDHATGYLAAFATMLALQRRAQEGGSWQVRVSLAQTGHWLQSMARRGLHENAAELSPAEIAASLQVSDSAYGQISAVRPVEQMAATPAYFDKPPAPLGTHAAQW